MDNSIQAHFNGKTKFKLLHNSFPQIPQHRFYLLDYNQLKNRIDKTKLLTDLFGCVKSIMPVEEVNTRDGIESKCEITLQNLRREETRVTLWGDSARKVDIDTIESLPPPVLMVITSLKVKKYKEMPAPSNTSHTCIFINPEIPQAEPYKIEFSKATDNIKKLSAPSKQLTAAEAEKEDKTTVHQYLYHFCTFSLLSFQCTDYMSCFVEPMKMQLYVIESMPPLKIQTVRPQSSLEEKQLNNCLE